MAMRKVASLRSVLSIIAIRDTDAHFKLRLRLDLLLYKRRELNAAGVSLRNILLDGHLRVYY